MVPWGTDPTSKCMSTCISIKPQSSRPTSSTFKPVSSSEVTLCSWRDVKIHKTNSPSSGNSVSLKSSSSSSSSSLSSSGCSSAWCADPPLRTDPASEPALDVGLEPSWPLDGRVVDSGRPLSGRDWGSSSAGSAGSAGSDGGLSAVADVGRDVGREGGLVAEAGRSAVVEVGREAGFAADAGRSAVAEVGREAGLVADAGRSAAAEVGREAGFVAEAGRSAAADVGREADFAAEGGRSAVAEVGREAGLVAEAGRSAAAEVGREAGLAADAGREVFLAAELGREPVIDWTVNHQWHATTRTKLSAPSFRSENI